MMTEEFQRRQEIAAATNVDVFSASYNGRYSWPNKLAHCDGVKQSVRDSCFNLMLDSAYSNDDTTNSDIIKACRQYDPEYIIPKDYPGDAEMTLDSLREFLELYSQEQNQPATVVPVLQPPYAKHYNEYEDFYSQFGCLAVGGLQAYSTEEQITIIKEVRDAVGPHIRLHGFGVGTSFQFVQAQRSHQNFLDSFDISTAEIAIKCNKIPDGTLKQRAFTMPGGEDSTSVRAQFTVAVLVQLNYILSHKVDMNRLREEYETETELQSLQSIIEGTEVRSRHQLNFGEMATHEDGQSTLLNYSSS
jgi:hypothetical protein